MARSKSYRRDVRERAVALVFEQVKTGQYSSQWEAIRSVASKIGASGETVRKWVRQAEVDAGARAGTSSEESAELRRLRREVHELRRANECHEAGGLPPGARLLVLARKSVSEGGRLSWCTSGWT